MFSRAPVAFVGLVFLLACTGEPESEVTPGDEPSVRISQGTDLLSLDPYARLESPSFCIQRNIFEPLTDYDQNIDLQPCLAESWRYETPTSWLFELRKGVVFQEGQPFTAQDVVFSIRRALDWPLTRVSSEILSIDTVQKVDTHTVRITTHDPDAILPLRLAMILMLDRESTEPMIQEHGQAWLATHANGTGPYRVEDWTRDVQCVLRANETYRNGPPEVKRLEFVPMANDATRMAALERGNIDIMVHVPPRYANRIEAMPDHRLVRQPGMRLIYLGLDVGRDRSPGVPASPPNPLKDRRVRRAMALAIDNRLIVEKIMAGHAVPADQLFPEPVTGYDPTIEPVGTHLERARGLLAEAGYPQGFRIRLDGPNDRYVNDEQILQAVAAQLGRVGIQVMVNAQPKARFFSEEEQGRCSFFPAWLVQHQRGRRGHLRTPTPHPCIRWGTGCAEHMHALLKSTAGSIDPPGRPRIRCRPACRTPPPGPSDRHAGSGPHPVAHPDGSLCRFGPRPMDAPARHPGSWAGYPADWQALIRALG